MHQRYPIDTEVQAPGFACPSCRTLQVEGGEHVFASQLTEALIVAFKPLEPLHAWKGS